MMQLRKKKFEEAVDKLTAEEIEERLVNAFVSPVTERYAEHY